MIYGYARISMDGQSVDAQVTALTDAGAEKVFREVASGGRLLDALGSGRKASLFDGRFLGT